jgi:thiol-disulfide isomerase/thioredoxin
VTDRAMIALALVALTALAVWVGRRWYTWRNERIETRLRQAALSRTTGEPASDDRIGAPRIVYFTTRTCVVCKAQQEPAMDALRARVDDLVLERHDAVVDSALASEYGVLSVPTTAVYDRAGRLVTINRGFTPAAVLLAQIEGRDPDMESGAIMASESVT